MALLASACSADRGAYPSLGRRPAERISGTAPVVAPDTAPAPVAAPPSPEMAARLAQLIAQAEAADRRFQSVEGRARSLTSAAAGAAVASESWAVATVALAQLESARSEAMIALADLDALYAAERVAGGDGAAIGSTRDRVIALVTREDRILAELRGRLRS